MWGAVQLYLSMNRFYCSKSRLWKKCTFIGKIFIGTSFANSKLGLETFKFSIWLLQNWLIYPVAGNRCSNVTINYLYSFWREMIIACCSTGTLIAIIKQKTMMNNNNIRLLESIQLPVTRSFLSFKSYPKQLPLLTQKHVYTHTNNIVSGMTLRTLSQDTCQKKHFVGYLVNTYFK